MNFVIISHTPHLVHEGKTYAYGPYVKEMNLWIRHFDEVVVVAPLRDGKPDPIHLPYEHRSLRVSEIPAIAFTSVSKMAGSVFKIPGITWKIFQAMREADHIHLRCPGNIGLLGCIIQVLFPKKKKTAKYAGNWDPDSQQPLSYRLQKWMLSNTFLTKNMQVLVYGNWPDASKNIKPFFTATYPEHKITEAKQRQFEAPFHFLFVGSLAAGKRPMYAVKLVEGLKKRGVDCTLSLYGEGPERKELEQYISKNSLHSVITLHGNKAGSEIETAYKKSDVLLLPSKSEGWPKVVAEAMFWGTVPVVTKISCVPWMLDQGNRGILLDMELKKDTDKLAAMLANTIVLKELSRKAQQWSHRYTLTSFEAELEKLI